MSFPPASLAINYEDSTAMASIHPGAHNAVNAAVNDIVAYIQANPNTTQEQIQDWVGAFLADSAVIDVTYDDAGNLISFTLAPGAVTAVMLAGSIGLDKLTVNPLARANHTGTQTLSTISDAGALAALSEVGSAQITNGSIVDGDVNASAAIAVTKLGITGTPTGSKYLRDDGSWQPLTGASGAAGGDLTGTYPNPTLAVDRTEKTGGGKEVRQSHGNTGATETIDLANGNVHVVAQDQACTYTFTGFTNGVSCSMTLIMTSVTGAATWPAAVKWSNGTPPTLTGVCVLTFVSVDGGTTIYGFLAGSGMA